jgi:small GTP-binding protein
MSNLKQLSVSPSEKIIYSNFTTFLSSPDLLVNAEEHFLMALKQNDISTCQWFLSSYSVNEKISKDHPDALYAYKRRVSNNNLRNNIEEQLDWDAYNLSVNGTKASDMSKVISYQSTNNAVSKTVKILFTGGSVGKSSIITRYVEDRFNSNQRGAIGVDFFMKTIMLDKHLEVKMQIWDIAAQERFHHITSPYYRGAEAIIIAYDITAWHTIECVKALAQHARTFCGSEVPIPIILIGNKYDLKDKREVPYEVGARLVEEENLTAFFECSAKTGVNVEQIFLTAARAAAIMRYQNKNSPPNEEEKKSNNNFFFRKTS